MPSVQKTMAADTLLDTHGSYLLLQLSHDTATADIRTRWQEDQAKLRAADTALKEALAEQLEVRSRRDWERPRLRNAFHAFANRIAESRDGRRATTSYQSYFPHGLTPLSRLSPDRLVATGRAILHTLGSETDESIVAAGESLRRSVEAAESIETAWVAAGAKVKERRAALEAAKVVWVAAYRRVDGELRAVYAGERSMVATFFYRRPMRKSAAEAEGGAANSEATKAPTTVSPVSGLASDAGGVNGVNGSANSQRENETAASASGFLR